MPFLFSALFSNQGFFPPPALPGISGTTSPSATPTARPVPRGIPVGACHATDGASRVATLSIFHACQHHYPGGSARCVRCCSSRDAVGLPLPLVGSAPATNFVEACSVFTRVLACMVAEPPKAALYHSASIYIVTSVNRHGCYQPEQQLLGGDSHPARKARLSTAHKRRSYTTTARPSATSIVMRIP